MNSRWMKRGSSRILAVTAMTSIAVIGYTGNAGAQDEEDDASVEGLYQAAANFTMAGQHKEASEKFEKMFDLSGGAETLAEDYGAQAGGFYFDYGLTLLPQQRWEDAKEAFTTCIGFAELAKEVETPIKSTNARESLARYQLGFCEAQLNNHEEAVRLYEVYINSNPPPNELSQIRNGFKLRMGTSLMKLGRVAEGTASVQELFDNREEWQVSPQILMQGILEMGLAWVDDAKAAGTDEVAVEEISDRGHEFLDKNVAFVKVDPLSQFRFGFVDRFKKLALESTRSGLYSLALRYLSFTPTVDDIRTDIQLSLARLPIGAGVPSQYKQLLDSLDEREKAGIHPDAETLRLVATCYDRLGNLYAPRAIYWQLAEQYPDIDPEKRGEILHEAARFSAQVGDYSAAQYFGDLFMAELPADHKLRNNVSTFMLQSLFTNREYDLVTEISEKVRERYSLGDAERELADSLYPLALYSKQRHEDAEVPFDEYVKSYEDSPNREMVVFHRASNSLILGKMRTAAEQLDDFIAQYPESENFIEPALESLALARYNLEDYPAAIAASDKLEEMRPESKQLPRALTVEGDAYMVIADNAPKDDEAAIAEATQKGLDAYLAAIEKGKVAQAAADEGQVDYFKFIVAEAMWKATDEYYTQEKFEEGLVLYDDFVDGYSGSYWEPQISVFSLDPLEAAGRGEEGLIQVEKMINVLGNKPPEEQDLDLLRQAIGSYAEASVRIRGVEKTIATLRSFPGMDPENKALDTWLKIQIVIVLQESRKDMEKDTAEYAAIESQIADVFEELRLFEKRQLSEFALQQIGLYLAKTENPFLATPYFEELLSRTNEEAEGFKAPAEMEIARIEMRSPDAAKVVSARERFRRVIDQYKDKALTPYAYLELGRLHSKNKEWKDAVAALGTINKNKKWLKGSDLESRAEAGFLLGVAYDELKDPLNANAAYLSVVSTYGKYYDWVTQSWERYIPNSLADINAMPANTPEEQAAKRARQLALYKLSVKYLFIWQKLTDEDAPSGALRRLRRDLPTMKAELGITPEEEAKVRAEIGLPPEEGAN